PLHSVPPRLQAARQATDSGLDADARPRDRARERRPQRVHGQRSRSRRREHVLLWLRSPRDRARLVPARRPPPERRWALLGLRPPPPRSVRGIAGALGAEAPSGAARADGGVSMQAAGRSPRSAAELVAEQHGLAVATAPSWDFTPGVAVGACFVCFERGT